MSVGKSAGENDVIVQTVFGNESFEAVFVRAFSDENHFEGDPGVFYVFQAVGDEEDIFYFIYSAEEDQNLFVRRDTVILVDSFESFIGIHRQHVGGIIHNYAGSSQLIIPDVNFLDFLVDSPAFVAGVISFHYITGKSFGEELTFRSFIKISF